MKQTSKYFYLILIIIVIIQYSSAQNMTYTNDEKFQKVTEIKKTEKSYQLYFNGEPFYIKCAGLGNVNIEDLAKHGANALRTWSADNGKKILNEAHKHGLKVMMGIWVGLERHGFDYNDDKTVNKQLESIKKL